MKLIICFKTSFISYFLKINTIWCLYIFFNVSTYCFSIKYLSNECVMRNKKLCVQHIFFVKLYVKLLNIFQFVLMTSLTCQVVSFFLTKLTQKRVFCWSLLPIFLSYTKLLFSQNLKIVHLYSNELDDEKKSFEGFVNH